MSEQTSNIINAQEQPKAEVKSDEQLFYGNKVEGEGAPKAEESNTPLKAMEEPKAEPEKSGEGKESDTAKPVETTKEAEKEETKPKDDKAVVPEKYELKLPKESLLKPETVDEIISYAKEKGLSNEQAQDLLEKQSNSVAEFHQNQLQEFNKLTNETWVEQAVADKEIGGEKLAEHAELAKRVVNKFGTPEFKKILSEGYGNHPEIVRIFARIGRAMADDTYVKPGASAQGHVPLESMFYPDQK